MKELIVGVMLFFGLGGYFVEFSGEFGADELKVLDGDVIEFVGEMRKFDDELRLGIKEELRLEMNPSLFEIIDIQRVKGVILPHHLMVESEIEKIYREVSRKRDVKTVVLLSPNHFGYGFERVIGGVKVKGLEGRIDDDLLNRLAKAKIIGLNSAALEKEHGLYSHYELIAKAFPEAKVAPIMIKNGASEKILMELIEVISKEEKMFLIASVDFSHYMDEVFSVVRDLDTVKNLKKLEGGIEDWRKLALGREKEGRDAGFEVLDGAVAMDCAECVWVWGEILKKIGGGEIRAQVVKRTSTAEFAGLLKAKDGTSHLYVVGVAVKN